MRMGRTSEWFILIVMLAICCAFAWGWRQSDRKLKAMEDRDEALIDAGLARMEKADAAPAPAINIAAVRPEPSRWYEPEEWDRLNMGRKERAR